MQFKQTLLALSLTVVAMPVLPAFDAATHAERNSFNAAKKAVTLEHINAAHVTKAQQAIANEATWATPVRCVGTALALAAIGYGVYKYWSKPTTASKEVVEKLASISTQDKDKIITGAATFFDELEKAKKLAEAAAKKVQDDSYWYQRLGTSVKENVAWAGSWALGGAIFTTVNASAQYGMGKVASYIPSTGTLQWYLSARTDYDRNLNDAMRYLSFYELFQDEIGDVVGLIVIDMEKALGYLGYFEQLLVEQKSPEYMLTQCTRYRTNIELLTNNLVDAMNTNAPMADVMNKVRLLDAEVRSAKGFVSANYN